MNTQRPHSDPGGPGWSGQAGRHWRGIVVYLVVVTVSIWISGYLWIEHAGHAAGKVLLAASVCLVVVGCLAVHSVILQDSAQLRARAGGWNPKWWEYIALGLGGPILLSLATVAVTPTVTAIGSAVVAFALLTWGVSVHYLYRRHRSVAVR